MMEVQKREKPQPEEPSAIRVAIDSKDMMKAMKLTTSARVLLKKAVSQRRGSVDRSRFKTDEELSGDKSYISIEVLPTFI